MLWGRKVFFDKIVASDMFPWRENLLPQEKGINLSCGEISL
jgi:hypothetical protein